VKHVLLVLALVVGSSCPAIAQGAAPTSSPLSSVFSKIAGQVKSGPVVPPASAGAADDRVLAYKPSANVTAEVRSTFVNGLIARAKERGALNAATEKQVRDEFAKVDVAAEYQKVLKPKGYDVYNVATALTLYVVSSLEILDDVTTTDAQDRATYEQFRAALKTIPALATMSDADKQKFSEALLWLTAFQANDAEQARAGTANLTLADVKAQVRETLKSFNLDPALVKIGAKGLQAR